MRLSAESLSSLCFFQLLPVDHVGAMARDGVSEVFSVNQHASICGGFGPCPDTAYAYSQWDAKRRNSVTGAAGLQAATVSSVSSQLQSAQGDLPTMRL